MNIAYTLILAVLVYIAYQLYQLNTAKSAEKEERDVEKGEQRLREMFPNLYQGASEERKDEIKEFVEGNEVGNLTNYVYNERYKIILEKIEKENDEARKKKMTKRMEEIVSELRHWEELFDKAEEKKEISSWETSYLLWDYLKAVNDSFPERYTDMQSCIKYSGFAALSERAANTR